MEHGISVVCAARNNGPIENPIANEAPWIATVGASTLDRRFPALVQMDNGQFLYGESMYPGNQLSPTKEFELVYVTGEDNESEFCFRGYILRAKVGGKIVVCDRGVNGRTKKGPAVKESEGAAMIIGFDEALRLKAYINSTSILRNCY
jgi:hypothetical protein